MTDKPYLQPQYRDGTESLELLRKMYQDGELNVVQARHRDLLYRWILETDDKGLFPEIDEALKAVIVRWGDRAVNKEYERVRSK